MLALRSAVLLAAVVSAATGRAGIWSLLLAVAIALSLNTCGRSALSRLPAAVLLLAGLVVTTVTAAGLLGLRLLAAPSSARLLLLALTVIVAVPVLLAPLAARPRLAEGSELVACLPAAVLVLVAARLHARDLPDAVGAFLRGWDNGAHALFTADIARSGGLSYEVEGYPRGLHAIVALVLNARTTFAATPEGLEALLRAQSLSVWLLLAALCASVALTALRLAEFKGLAGPPAVATAMAAGLAVLNPTFFGFLMRHGFETTVAVALVLAVLTLELLQRQPAGTAWVVYCAAVALTAHTYQLLLPVLVLPLLAAAVRLARRPPRERLTAALVSLPLLAGAAPPTFSVLRNLGVEAVSIPGAAPGAPLLWLLAGVGAAVWLAASRTRELQVLASVVLVVVALAWAGSAATGAPLSGYYPSKLLWHAALVGLPLLTVAVAVGLATAGRRWRSNSAVRLVPVVAACVALPVLATLAAPGPFLASSGAWNVGAEAVAAMQHPQDGHRVCLLQTEYDLHITLRMLTFYRQQPTLAPACDQDEVGGTGAVTTGPDAPA